MIGVSRTDFAALNPSVAPTPRAFLPFGLPHLTSRGEQAQAITYTARNQQRGVHDLVIPMFGGFVPTMGVTYRPYIQNSTDILPEKREELENVRRIASTQGAITPPHEFAFLFRREVDCRTLSLLNFDGFLIMCDAVRDPNGIHPLPWRTDLPPCDEEGYLYLPALIPLGNRRAGVHQRYVLTAHPIFRGAIRHNFGLIFMLADTVPDPAQPSLSL